MKQDKAWWHLSNQVFSCQSDALAASATLKKTLKYHKVSAQVIEVSQYKGRGRPKSGNTPKVVGYQIQYDLTLDEARIEALKSQKGRFRLATNQLDETVLSSLDILTEYKAHREQRRDLNLLKTIRLKLIQFF